MLNTKPFKPTCLVLFYILFFFISSSGNENFNLPHPLISFKIFEDNQNLQIEDLTNLPDSIFQNYDGEILSQDNFYWIKFTASKNNSEDETYIMYFNSLISHIFLYQPDNNGHYTVNTGGSLIPYKKRTLGGLLKDKVPFYISGKSTVTYYVKLKTILEHTYSLANLEVISEKKFNKMAYKTYIVQSFFLGVIAIIFILNFTLYFLTRDKLYMFYFSYTVTVALFFAYYNQISEQFLFSNNPRLDLQLSTAVSLVPLIYLWFLLELLKLENIPKWHMGIRKYTLITTFLALSLIIISIFDYHLYVVLNDYYLMLNGIVTVAVFFLLFKKVSILVKIVISGSLFMIIGGMASIIGDFSKISTTHLLYYQTGVLIELILFTIAVNFIYNNERISKIKIQLKNSLLITEQLQKEKEAILLKEEIDEKNRILASKAIIISQKEVLINEVIEELSDYKKKHDGSQGVESVISNLKSCLKKNNLEEFEVLFQKVHPDFYKSLNIKYPGLTINEKKICAFLKLGFTTKEISEITGKSINTIDVARFRLRKKMNLRPDENLTSLISNIV